MRSSIWIGLLLAIACGVVVAADLPAKKPAPKPEEKQPGKPQAKPAKGEGIHLPGPFHIPHVKLSESQQAALTKLAAQYSPKLHELDEAAHAVLSEEQHAAKKAARDKAHAEGKKGKESGLAADQAVKLSPEQTAKIEELHARKKKLDEEIVPQIAALLTPEQKSAAGGRFQEKPQPNAKPKGEPEKKPEAQKDPPKEKGKDKPKKPAQSDKK